MSYDPDCDITAGELRLLGVAIDAQIPDVAHVPKSSIVYQSHAVEWVDATTLRANVTATFTVPFRWVEMTVEFAK